MRITEMVESKEDTELSFTERIKYRTHLAFCKTCRSYEKQSALIDRALSRLMSSTPKNSEPMDDAAKKKILDKIKRNEN
ncbi:hypothetical protein LX92_03963 [Maribacter polysiphoniae]|nr:hypothetical protein LX92_03963 [Maribacter polysiphoniae]